MPFNWKTPLGYTVAMSMQTFCLYIVITIGYCAILFPVALCVLLIEFCHDLENELQLMNETIKIGSKEQWKLSTNHCIDIKKKLRKIIRFRSAIKQLSEQIEHVLMQITS